MSTDPWATPADLAARWRPLAPGEAERARVLIEDAQSLIQDECPRWAAASAARDSSCSRPPMTAETLR